MPSAPTFTETWGCQMIAYIFDILLYGVTLILVAQYFYRRESGDGIFTKVTVGALFFFSTLHTAFLSHQIYTDYVQWFDKPDLLNIIPFSASTMLLAIYLTAFTAQIFFASRIWLLSKSTGQKILCCSPVVLLAVLQISFGIAQTVLVIKTAVFSRLETTARITSTQAGTCAACDIMITLVLCFQLEQARSGSRRTNSAVDKLILYAINRGAATSTAALVQLILFVVKPGTFIFMIFLLPSCHLYVISVVSMLITRDAIRNKLREAPETGSSFQLESMRSGRSGAGRDAVNRSHQSSQSPGVSVVTWTSMHRDDNEVLDVSKAEAGQVGRGL
ncbi:hypothetical protein Moror_11368 [Moniliophthora roreri MCA 2997]|uniref:DUF6534 domain-containing protein n=1 Tax=Moniliophthora roreri (strain MCA 2997) TaxID=1381753 RepID=V2WXL2_MONRO|nr:hypothetical protein Moror_11368 [Moniliophthora roreri MCA 2997]